MRLRLVASVLLTIMLMLLCTVVMAENKVQVSIWSTFTNDQDAYLRKTVEDFNASQDKYEVTVQTQPNQNFTSTVYNAVVNHEGPDIIFNYASEASKYVGAGLVANLDEYIYDEEIGIPDFDNLLPGYLQDEINGFEDGHIHYLPGATTGPILYYNKTMLEELGLTVPSTWAELEEVCKAIKAAKPEVTPFGIDSKVDITQTVMLESGATYIDVENKQVGFAGAVDAVVWLGKQIQDGLFTLTAPSGGYFSNDFNSGLVAMYYGSCAGVPYIAPDGFEYGVAPAPTNKSENAAYTIWNRGPIVFSANGEEAAEGAYMFVKYMLTTPEIAEGWAETQTGLTPWLNAQQVDGYSEYIAGKPALSAVAGNIGIGVSFPSVTGASEIRDAIGEMISMIGDGADAADALAACVEASNDALKTRYLWANDYQSLTGIFYESNGDIISETIYNITEIVIDPTCEEKGSIIYRSGKFENNKFQPQRKTITFAEPLGHDWGDLQYAWSDENQAVVYAHVCKRDESHLDIQRFLHTLVLPAQTRTVGEEAFAGLRSAEAVYLSETVSSIAADTFDHGIIIAAPEGSYALEWAQEKGFEYIAVRTTDQ